MLDEYAQEQIDQQRLFMLNQDPPEHTRPGSWSTAASRRA